MQSNGTIVQNPSQLSAVEGLLTVIDGSWQRQFPHEKKQRDEKLKDGTIRYEVKLKIE
jgi:hypothetical protein